MKKLLILDSNSIINRAFYGISMLNAPDGTPTNGVYGFMNILFKLLTEEKPDYLCAAFDLKAPTFRHKMYDGYKAQRKPMPDDLRPQLPLAKDILSAMNVPILQLEGYEADDIIGTVSRLCEANDIECLIATGDKDDLQLATKNTHILLSTSAKGVTTTASYDDDAVFERYGVSPIEFIDVKALMGDASDNIPGVAGIGEKTATKLIAKYSTIEALYAEIDKGDERDKDLKGAMLNKLIDGRDSATLSKVLATIDTKVPITFDFTECEYSASYNTEALLAILTRLGLNSFIKKLGIEDTISQTATNEMLDSVVVSTSNNLEDTISKLDKANNVALLVDYTNSPQIKIALSQGDNNTVVSTDKENALAGLVRLINEYKTITFDIKDTLVWCGRKASVRNMVGDVAVAAYLVDSAKSKYELEELCHTYLGIRFEMAALPQNEQLSLLDEPAEDDGAITDLFGKKAYALSKLWDELYKKLEANNQLKLYYDIELPLVEVLASMQYLGFKVDRDEIDSFGKELSARADELNEQIQALAGKNFNVNSPKQLGVILFEDLGLDPIKKTKSGYSTNADVLEKLVDKHPIINLILEYRTISKLKSTYCDGLTNAISSDGKIHSVFNQTVTVTGRISSSEPNLQNIPTRTELGRRFRKMFIASDTDHTLVDADYSQIELRVLSHIANDQTMIDAFKSGEDIHAVTASQVFGVPLSEVTSTQRSSAKAVNFGIVYGIGEYSLSQDLHISVKQAKEYINSYLDKYEGVRKYMEEIKSSAKANGFVTTLWGRRRVIPEISSSNYNIRSFGERVALNTPIQGTAADIIKLAMVRVYNRLKDEGLKSELILQVHDELIIDTVVSEEVRVRQLLQQEMENVMQLSVPLVADTASGVSWYDAK